MLFSNITGHEDVKRRLREMVDDNRLPHAIILEGPSGIGKFAMAQAFIQYLHCTNRTPDGNPCGKCQSCLQHRSLNHIDTYYSYPVVKRKGGGVTVSADYITQWRQFVSTDPYLSLEAWQSQFDNVNTKPTIYVDESEEITRMLSYTARASQYRVVVIWLPERMNVECANKLLKLIEEPQPGSMFVLVSDRPQEILPTIYSRCQRVTMLRLSDDEVLTSLIAEGVLSDDAITAARIAQGNMIAAHAQLNLSAEARESLDLFMQLMRLAYQRKVNALKKWSNDVAALGRERQLRFLTYCLRQIRENFIYNLASPDLIYLNSQEMSFSSKFAQFINERNVIKMHDLFEQAAVDIAGNVNAKIVFFDMAIKVIIYLRAGS